MSASTPIAAIAGDSEESGSAQGQVAEQKRKRSSRPRDVAATSTQIVVNEALFRPSEWDDYPLKRDDKYTNKIVQPDFAPFSYLEEPEKLPEGFEFVALDVRDEPTLVTITEFLNENYEGPFSFETSHVQWVLNTPTKAFPHIDLITKDGGCVLGVATSDSKKLVGIIAARPITYSVDGRVICSLEVIWLCTIKQLRGKRLASVMMKELYRRAYCWGIATGMLFCVPRQLPALYTVGPMVMLGRTFEGSPPKPNKGIGLIRFANKRDITRMMKIYKGYREHWRLHREYNKREFQHTFLRREDVMTYVIRKENGDVKDFVSLFRLLEGEKRIAYVHFVSFLNDKLLELIMQNVLYIMHRNKFDAVYIADVNGVGGPLTSKLGFSTVNQWGTSYLYQFNYNTITIPPNESQICGSL